MHWLLIVVVGALLLVGLVELCKTPWYHGMADVYVEGRDGILIAEILSSRDLRAQKLKHDPAWLAAYEQEGQNIDAAEVPFRLLFLSPQAEKGIYEFAFADTFHFSVVGPGGGPAVQGVMDHPVWVGNQQIALESKYPLRTPVKGQTFKVHTLDEEGLRKKIRRDFNITQVISASAKVSMNMRSPDSAFAVDFLQGLLEEMLAQEMTAATMGIDSSIRVLERQVEQLNISLGQFPGFLEADKGPTLKLFQDMYALEAELKEIGDIVDWVGRSVREPVRNLPVWTEERILLLQKYDSLGAAMLRHYLDQGLSQKAPLLRGDLTSQLAITEMKLKMIEKEAERKVSVTQVAYMSQINSVIYKQEKKLDMQYEQAGVREFLALMQLERELILLQEKRANVNCGIRVIVSPHAIREGRMAYPNPWFFWVPFTCFWLMLAWLTRKELMRQAVKKQD
jgi:hypothetical protein